MSSIDENAPTLGRQDEQTTKPLSRTDALFKKLGNIPLRFWNPIAFAVLTVSLASVPFLLMDQFDYGAYVTNLRSSGEATALEARQIFWADYFAALLSAQALQHFLSTFGLLVTAPAALLFAYMLLLEALDIKNHSVSQPHNKVLGLNFGRAFVFCFIGIFIAFSSSPFVGGPIMILCYLIVRHDQNPISKVLDLLDDTLKVRQSEG